MTIPMKYITLTATTALLFLSACDRHQWEGEDGVKELYEHHDESHGGHDEHGSHGKDSHDQHGKKEDAH